MGAQLISNSERAHHARGDAALQWWASQARKRTLSSTAEKQFPDPWPELVDTLRGVYQIVRAVV